MGAASLPLNQRQLDAKEASTKRSGHVKNNALAECLRQLCRLGTSAENFSDPSL
jgi:hypothetical protein